MYPLSEDKAARVYSSYKYRCGLFTTESKEVEVMWIDKTEPDCWLSKPQLNNYFSLRTNRKTKSYVLGKQTIMKHQNDAVLAEFLIYHSNQLNTKLRIILSLKYW